MSVHVRSQPLLSYKVINTAMIERAPVTVMHFLVMWLCLVTVLPHSTIFQRFDTFRNQTYRKEAAIYLGMPVTETTAAICHDLFRGAANHEITHCCVMAAQTLRDHLSALLVTTTKRPEFGQLAWPQSAVTTLALSYAYDSAAYDETRSDRVCFVGVPSPYDFLVVILSNNVEELWILVDGVEDHMLDKSWEQSMERVASALDKRVLVLRGAPRETIEQVSVFSITGRPCDVLHIQDTGGASRRDLNGLVRVAADACEEEGAPLQLVYVSDIDLTARTSSLPLVSASGRWFAAHNTTDGLFAPPQLDSANVRWLLGSVWVNESTLAATANWDGMTGRSYGTALRPQQPGTGRAIPWMRQVWVGESSGARSSKSGDYLTAGGAAASNFNHLPARVRAPAEVTVVLSYTIRVFGETARGLRAALRSLGYARVVILPDVTLAALRLLEETVVGDGERGQDCKGCLLQIALGPHDFTMLLQRFVAFQMEQVMLLLLWLD